MTCHEQELWLGNTSSTQQGGMAFFLSQNPQKKIEAGFTCWGQTMTAQAPSSGLRVRGLGIKVQGAQSLAACPGCLHGGRSMRARIVPTSQARKWCCTTTSAWLVATHSPLGRGSQAVAQALGTSSGGQTLQPSRGSTAGAGMTAQEGQSGSPALG